MKTRMLTGRRRWIVAGTAGALLIGSAALATTAMADDGDDDPGSTDQAVGPTDDDGFGDDGSDDDGFGDDDDSVDDGSGGNPPPSTSITPGQAADIALGTVGDGIVESVELENTGGAPVWSVDVLTSAGGEHDVRVDAASGGIAEHRTDDDDELDDWNEESPVAQAATVAIDDATATALAEVGGGVVTSVELEGSASAPRWNVDVATDDGDFREIRIDAQTGSVAAVNDDDDDDDRGHDDDDDDDHGDDDDDDHGWDDDNDD